MRCMPSVAKPAATKAPTATDKADVRVLGKDVELTESSRIEAPGGFVETSGDRISIVISDATPGTLTLDIVDNGKGLDPMTNDGHGHGLSNMTHRAEALGGRLAFSAEEPGLRIALSIPLSQACDAVTSQAA